jgi:ribosome modulation factor
LLAAAATLLLATLGVSLYRTHAVRAQIYATLEQARPAQALVVAAFERQGAPPRDAAEAGIDDTVRHLLMGTYVDALRITNGRIDLLFGKAADSAIVGKTLSLTPFETADRQVVWLCGNRRAEAGLNPLGFASGGPQPVQIAVPIDDRYLPLACR